VSTFPRRVTRWARPLVLVLAIAATAVLPAGTAMAGAANPSVVVHTDQGVVRGSARDGLRAFLGIPYAAPPVGNLRWRAPQPAAAWRGVRDATTFAPHCAQSARCSADGGSMGSPVCSAR